MYTDHETRVFAIEAFRQAAKLPAKKVGCVKFDTEDIFGLGVVVQGFNSAVVDEIEDDYSEESAA